MSLEKKLERKYNDGLLAGYQDTWSFFEKALDLVNGIGPKRKKAVLDKVQELARERYQEEMTANGMPKLRKSKKHR